MKGNRKYQGYLGASALASFGYSLYSITIPLFSYIYSGSLIFTGIALFVEYGIYSSVSLVGPLVDRVNDRRYIFLPSYVIIAACSIMLGILIIRSQLGYAEFLLLIAGIAIGWNFGWTADHVAIPLLVDRNDIGSANGYLEAVTGSHSIGGFFAGGFLLLVLGPSSVFILYGIVMLASASLFVFISLRGGEKTGDGSYIEGWKYLFGRRRILVSLSVFLSAVGFFGLAPQLFITYMSPGRVVYTLSFSLFFTGMSVTGLLMGRFHPDWGPLRTIVLSTAGTGIFLFGGVLLFSDPLLDYPIWFLAGSMLSMRLVSFRSYLQRIVEPGMLGRAVSSLYTFRGVTSSVGVLAVPAIILAFGDVRSSAVFCAVLVAISLIFLAAAGRRSPGSASPESAPSR